MRMEEMLRDEIATEFEDLTQIEMGTEEYKKSVEGLTKLVDRVIEIDRLNIEAEEKNRKMNIEEEKAQLQAAEYELNLKREKREKIDTCLKHGIAVLTLGVTTGVTVWGALRSWQFEDPECYGSMVTSTPGKAFMNKLFKK